MLCKLVYYYSNKMVNICLVNKILTKFSVRATPVISQLEMQFKYSSNVTIVHHKRFFTLCGFLASGDLTVM